MSCVTPLQPSKLCLLRIWPAMGVNKDEACCHSPVQSAWLWRLSHTEPALYVSFCPHLTSCVSFFTNSLALGGGGEGKHRVMFNRCLPG